MKMFLPGDLVSNLDHRDTIIWEDPGDFTKSLDIGRIRTGGICMIIGLILPDDINKHNSIWYLVLSAGGLGYVSPYTDLMLVSHEIATV